MVLEEPKYSCEEINDMQQCIAKWMCDIEMQEHENDKKPITLTADQVIEGYDYLMANLYFLDVLRARLERMRAWAKDMERQLRDYNKAKDV